MKRKATGFTLIELMIVLAIVAIITVAAAPSMSQIIKKNRVETQLRGFANLLGFARSEAVTTQRNVAICRLVSNQCSTTWSGGTWTVFYDDDGQGDLDLPATETLKVHDGSGFNVMEVKDVGGANPAIITYNSRGILAGGTSMTIKLCDKDADVKYARALILQGTGAAFYSGADSITNIYKDIWGLPLSC